jgi:hypothetical protein
MSRNPSDQNIHDHEIRCLQDANDKNFYIITNPGQEKNQCLDGNYPDLLLYSKTDRKTLLNIIEVETVSTVTKSHAEEQWVSYYKSARKYSASFYLDVPKSHVRITQNICSELKIEAKILGY